MNSSREKKCLEHTTRIESVNDFLIANNYMEEIVNKKQFTFSSDLPLELKGNNIEV